MEQKDNANSISAEDALRAFLKDLVLDPLSKEQATFLRKLSSEISTSIEGNDSLLEVKDELDKLYKELDKLKQSINKDTEVTQSSVEDIQKGLTKYSQTIVSLQNILNDNKSTIEEIHYKVESISSNFTLNSKNTNNKLKVILYMQLFFIIVFSVYVLMS